MSSLDWSDVLLKDLDGVVLRVVVVVFLGVDAQAMDFVVSDGVKDNDFARHVECLHPFLELIEHGLINR